MRGWLALMWRDLRRWMGQLRVAGKLRYVVGSTQGKKERKNGGRKKKEPSLRWRGSRDWVSVGPAGVQIGR